MDRYNDIEWLWVQKVVRADETHVELIRDRFITTFEYNTAEQCLRDFLYLKKKWRNYASDKRKNQS